MNKFIEWCAVHAPGFFDNYRDSLFVFSDDVILCSAEAWEMCKLHRRIPYSVGISLANIQKEITIYASALEYLAPFMKTVYVTDQAGWMASLGKDVLTKSVVGEMGAAGTIVVVKNNDFVVALGSILEGDGLEDSRAIRIITDVGRFLHSKATS